VVFNTINWIKELYKKNKNKLVCSARINYNIIYPINLDKQKVSPALALFSIEIKSALRPEFSKKAK